MNFYRSYMPVTLFLQKKKAIQNCAHVPNIVIVYTRGSSLVLTFSTMYYLHYSMLTMLDPSFLLSKRE